MRIPLRAFFIGLLVFFVFMGAIFVYLATQAFQHSLLEVSPEVVSEDFIQEATLSIAIQQGFIVVSMLILIGGMLFFMLTAFVLTPIRKLHTVFGKVGEENFKVRLPEGPQNEIGDLFRAFNDMTARLERAKKREDFVNQMKSDFVSLAAHQLRTPLSTAKWALSMLVSGDMGKLTKKQEEFLSKTYASNERMIDLVNDLLNVARIEEGKYLYESALVSIEEIIKRAVESLNEEAKRHNVELVFINPPNNLPKVFAGGEELQLVVQNLVDNAVQYTKQGIGGKVEIRAFQRNNHEIEVTVQDTGKGIPAHEQGRVFERFFRGVDAKKVNTEGSGLGLYIAKNIVEAHKGEIWFESKEGEGTTFHFTVPLQEKA